MTHQQFELVGGSPALDFLNTIHDWTVPEPRDYLADFSDALRFGEVAGVLTRAEVRRLAGEPGQGELERLRELRTLMERVFRAAVLGRDASPADLDRLARAAAEAAGTARLRCGDRGRIVRQVDPGAAGGALLRWRIVESAVALLTSPRFARVKACPSCGWFFLDASKNRSRRWCSMATCGTSAKARRYYRRKKASRRAGRRR